MKTNKTSKIITCVILSIIVLLSTLSTNAEEYISYATVYKGKVTAAEFGIDLSGLEIEVYSAEKAVSKFDDGSDFVYYGLTYDHSVYTDKDGAFSFEKPSECFSYSVKLSSLPKGYGIDNNSNFCYAKDGMKKGNISIFPISRVEAEYTGSGEGVSPRIFDAQGNTLMAEYTVTKDTLKVNDYETLVSLNELILTGTITVSQVDFAYKIPVDMGGMSVLTKIDTLYELGAIDESTRIEFCCYALMDSRAKIDCGTSLLAEIQAYKNAHKNEKLSSSLQNAIDSVIESHTMSNRALSSAVSGNIGAFSYVVNYDSSVISDIGAQRVADEFESIYNYFVTNRGFASPIPYNATVYKINLNVISSGALGYTYPNGSGGSYIEIAHHVVNNSFNSTSSYNSLKKILAHEFFHAITFTYDMNLFSSSYNHWFTEGFADFAGLLYTGATEATLSSHITTYFDSTNQSLFRSNIHGGYGTFFYPYYIYLNLGGWNAIKSIFNQLPLTSISPSSIIQAITDSPYISTAGYAFLAAATRTYAPTYYYPLATSAWGAPEPIYFNYQNPSNSLEGMSYKFHKFGNGSNIANFNCNFNISGNDPSGMELNVIKTNDSNYYSIATLTTGCSQIYVELNNLSNTTAIVFCPVNTNAYNNLDECLTYSFSSVSIDYDI